MAIVFGALLCVPASARQGLSPNPQSPRYELGLNPAEYSITHAAISSGVSKYGGDADFRLRLARDSSTPTKPGEEAPLVWTLTITQPRLIDVLQLWMAEKTTELVGVVDLDKLDPQTKAAMKAVQSVNLKLQQAKLNPIWDLTVTPALVGVKDSPASPQPLDKAAPPIIYTLSAGDEMVEVSSPSPALAASLKPLVGKRAIVKGYVKAPGFIDLVAATPVQENTLELVVMSQCPFGTKAADAMIEHLKSPGNLAAGATSPPNLSIRYLFYKRQEQANELPPKSSWWSLHGDAEIEENLVQIVIRDTFADRFRDYVQKRAHAPTTKWQDLATQSGFAPSEIEMIAGQIKDNREKLIADEYAYVSNVLGVTDGSPTFVWESQIAKDIKKVAAFKTLDLNKGSCAGTAEGK